MVLKQPVVMNLWSKFWKVYEELFNVTFMYIFGTHYTCFVSSLRMLWLVWTQISNANWTLSHLDVHVSASDQFVKHLLGYSVKSKFGAIFKNAQAEQNRMWRTKCFIEMAKKHSKHLAHLSDISSLNISEKSRIVYSVGN